MVVDASSKLRKMFNKHFILLITVFVTIALFSSGFVVSEASQQNMSGLNPKVNDFQNKLFTQSINDQDIVKILYPLSSIPVFVEREGNFTIDFQTEDFDNIYAYISTAYEPVVDEIELEFESSWKTNSTWHATFITPLSTPVELYNLTLITEENDKLFSCSRPRAVSVIDNFSDNFSFIHITDFHIGDPRGMKENIRETIGWKAAKKCIEEVNLIHPDFVIISGDLVYGQLYPFEYSKEYKECFDILQGFDVPTFLCPGNHDGYYKFKEDGLEFWKEYFGPLNYSFNYGNYHFLAVNSFDWPAYDRFTFLFIPLDWGGCIQDNQLQWIEKDLSNSNANLTFMFLHHNPLWDTTGDSLLGYGYYNRVKLLSLIEKYDVDMVLAGHVHYDNVTILNKTTYITTTTASSSLGSDDAYWGYRLINIQNGQIGSYNYKDPKFSIPSYKLNCKFINPYTALVKNGLEKDINVHLRFLLPIGNYNVENGKILMQRENGNMVEIYVVSYVEKEGNVTVTLSLQSG